MAILDLTTIRNDLLMQLDQQNNGQLNEETVREIKSLTSNLDQVLFSWNDKSTNMLKLIAVATSEEAAISAEQSIARIVASIQDELAKAQQTTDLRDLPPEARGAFQAWMTRLRSTASQYLKPSRKGNRLIYEGMTDVPTFTSPGECLLACCCQPYSKLARQHGE